MSLFSSPVVRATDANINALSGAKWYFYTTGTTTPASVYTTEAMSVAHANPVVADSGGLFAPIYLNPAVTYRGILKDASGTTIQDIDPITTYASQADVQEIEDLFGSQDLGALPAGASITVEVNKTASGDSGGTTDWRSWINKVTYTGTNSAAQVNAMNSQTELRHTAGTVTYGYGIQGYNRLGLAGSSTGAVSAMRGVEWHIANEGSGNITDAMTFCALGFDLADGTGVITNGYSFYSGDIGHATRIGTKAYGFFQANISNPGVATAAFGSEISFGSNRYHIRCTGGASSVLGGRLRVGDTTAPTDFLEVVGGIRAHSSGGTVGSLGFGTSTGGTATQATNKSTGVTLNKPCGQITMNNASLASSTSVGFTLTNDQIAATDVVIVSIASGGTANSYVVGVDAVAAGSCHIHVRNVSGGSLGEALVLNFAVIKAVAA